jgi:hypothetical protein
VSLVRLHLNVKRATFLCSRSSLCPQDPRWLNDGRHQIIERRRGGGRFRASVDQYCILVIASLVKEAATLSAKTFRVHVQEKLNHVTWLE